MRLLAFSFSAFGEDYYGVTEKKKVLWEPSDAAGWASRAFRASQSCEKALHEAQLPKWKEVKNKMKKCFQQSTGRSSFFFFVLVAWDCMMLVLKKTFFRRESRPSVPKAQVQQAEAEKHSEIARASMQQARLWGSVSGRRPQRFVLAPSLEGLGRKWRVFVWFFWGLMLHFWA